MTEPRDRHLDETEIDALASAPELALNPDGAPEPVLRRALEHMAECESCKRKVLIYRAVQREITQSGPLQETSPGPDCAVDTNWIDVAAGLLPKPMTAELMKHASQCGYCGPRLKKAAETLFEEATPAEMKILSSLNSARPEWPKEMVKTLRGPEPDPVSGWRSYFRWPKLAFAAAMSATVALASWLTVVMLRPLPVEQLLAQASSERRILELRMPGAKYGKLQIERGAAKSSSDKASSLVKAESLIREHLDKTPNDPQWLQAQGRADLLEGDPDSAIKHFEKARESDPDSPSLMADLGSAYYARHIGSDWGKAYEWLDQALAKTPEDPMLVFNHAIVAESAGFPNVAEADWKHYLQLENSGEWSNEARERLKKLEEKKENYEKRHSQPLLEPSELEAQSGSPQIQAIVDARIEEYLHLAIQNWLPNAYPADGQHPPDMEARAALAVLSRIMHSKHKDAWLEDLLANSEGQGFGAAVQALSAALAGNDSGAYDAAYRESSLAERSFLAEHNPAGAMQARFQRLFALQFKSNGKLCAQIAKKDVQEVNTSYPWLQAQILLEESACLSTNVEIGQARSKIDQAMVIAQASRYNEIHLRCFTFSVSNAALIGDTKAVWTMVLESLNAFWAGNYPALRGYNLYTLLSEVAGPPAFPHLRIAAWSQGISLIDSDPDLLQRGLAHFYLAQAAMDAHLLPLFDREYQKYKWLMDSAPTGEAEKADRAEAQLQMAKMEARLGHLHQAHDELTGWLRESIEGSGNTYRTADFYATLGELELELGNYQDADRFLRSGLLVTEHILGTLSTETQRTEWERKALPIYRALVEEKLREEDAAGALEVWEWYLGAAIREPGAPTASRAGKHLFDRVLMEGVPLSTLTMVADNRFRLTRQTVLSYALLRDGVAIWAFDNRGVFPAYVHRDPREIEQFARHFLELCADHESDLEIVHKYGRELYNLLIAPIAAQLEPERGLIIEAEGALALMPFEALVDPASHYLGQERAIVSSLGLYYDLALRPLRPITPLDAGLVVAVASPKGFDYLPGLDTETKEVASRFSHPIALDQKEEATLPAVLRALPSATVFYFAGHAVAAPERTGLVMADLDPKTGDPRLLTAEMLKPESLKRLQIAVLAACNTDKGDEGNYSDTTSLVRAMVRGGVPSVLASRWNLISGAPDRLALPFVFPQKLSKISGHPYYWASLNQFGGLDVIPQ